MSEPVPSDASSDDAIQGVATSEMPSETPHGVSSPMPWEQMADASVQIPEPETPPTPEAFSALESVLASLRTEDKTVASSPAIEETPPEAPAASAHVAEPTPLETGQTESASLSAPMPWEQISDPAIQISVTEAAPTPPPQEFESNVSAAVPDILGSLAVSDAASSPQPAAERLRLQRWSPLTRRSLWLPAQARSRRPHRSRGIPSLTRPGNSQPAPWRPVRLFRRKPHSRRPMSRRRWKRRQWKSSVVEPPTVASPSGQEDLVAPVAPEASVSCFNECE